MNGNSKKGTVIITGGGSGIGQAAAIRLAREGFKIGIIGRREEQLKETVNAIKRINENVTYKTADVREKEQVWAAIDDISLRLGKLVGAVASAGIFDFNRHASYEKWDNILKTNLSGTYYTLTSAIEFMDKNDKPKQLIAISSTMARKGSQGCTAYCASKAGILGLVRALALEVAEKGIRVNAICPALVDTRTAQENLNKLASSTGREVDEIEKKIINTTPLKRMSSPDEIAGLISYLFGEGIMSFTGQGIDINNGTWMS